MAVWRDKGVVSLALLQKLLDSVYTIMYIYFMGFEWDGNKNQSNITKHGISFEEAIAVFDDPDILTFEDARFEYGEARLISINEIGIVGSFL